MKRAITIAVLLVFVGVIALLEYSFTLFLVVPDVSREKQINFALYTVSDNTLKMNAQMYPLEEEQSHQLTLEIKKNGKWLAIQTSIIDDADYGIPLSGQLWLASFRVENWDDTQDIIYRLNHDDISFYEGLIRKNPIDKEEIIVAAFTGNSNKDRRLKPDIIAAIKQQDPDLLFFSGDQSYDHRHHLHGWLLFGEQFGEITRDRPTVIITDDHDVGQLNLWGASGASTWSPTGVEGGYFMPAQYVNAVEKVETSHLPDPYDPTPVNQNIGVYYTSLNIGGVDFAIIEDRKFKSAPPSHDEVNEGGLVMDLDFDTRTLDDVDAKLLGDRQLTFIKDWAADWQDSSMKAVLSATIFANAAHIHGSKKFGRAKADLDSNGWPQSGRNVALTEIRKAFAPMIAGDQHLGTTSQLGVDNYKDSGYAFSVPSIVNYYARYWHPLVTSEPINQAQKYSGNYLDGFYNKLTMHAYANPTEENFDGAGYGLIRFNKTTRMITMECYQRQIDYTDGLITPKQHEGWPVVHHQEDNYGRAGQAWLPTIKVNGLDNPIIQIINEGTNEIEYTLRIAGNSWAPKVFAQGLYTIKVGDQLSKNKVIRNITAKSQEPFGEMVVDFD